MRLVSLFFPEAEGTSGRKMCVSTSYSQTGKTNEWKKIETFGGRKSSYVQI
jgi:hypothetical protein